MLELIQIRAELINKIDKLLTSDKASVAEAVGALLWLSASGVQNSGLGREEFFRMAGEIYTQVEEYESKSNEDNIKPDNKDVN